ncbi:MAG: DNA metabolism protein [Clostridiales bacterium]|nr:DNA metabolism protein [Clostridiales bacterium]
MEGNQVRSMLTEYIYDGTFEGFLCCVYAHYYEGKAGSITKVNEDSQQAFFTGQVIVETDEDKAMTVYHAIEKKISTFDLRRAYRIFLCDSPGKEMTLLNYLRFGFIKGSYVSNYHGNPIVRDAELLEKKVTRELDRLKGLLRFSVLEGNILYAEVEPDNNILEFLAPHFSDRYKSEAFIIHDLKRDRAVISKGGRWYISEFKPEDVPDLHDDEIRYRALWRDYFDHIAIKERTNPRCQKQFMPVRYWKHLTEMQR